MLLLDLILMSYSWHAVSVTLTVTGWLKANSFIDLFADLVLHLPVTVDLGSE